MKNEQHFQILPGIAVLSHDYQDETTGIWYTSVTIEVKPEWQPHQTTKIPVVPPIKATHYRKDENMLDATTEITETDARIIVASQFIKLVTQS